jgi:hypothetical protein
MRYLPTFTKEELLAADEHWRVGWWWFKFLRMWGIVGGFYYELERTEAMLWGGLFP